MVQIHDPLKQIGFLQQCLSSDKKPLGLFLGAGCPMAVKVDNNNLPIIPDIQGITRITREKLLECEECNPLLKVVEDHFQKDGRKFITVEDILSHIRALRVVAGKEEVRGLSANKLDILDEKICKIIHEVVDKVLPTGQTPYHNIALWADAVRRGNPIEVFTTNYDLLMEQAFEYCRVPYFDGFAGVRKPFFDLRAMEEDMLPPRWARLWKLHGSINWYYASDKGVFRGTTNEDSCSKRIIHPSHLKYQESRRMPYLAMIDRLRAFLKHPTATLVICGYSFRDEHINEIIVQGLQSTQTTIAFTLLFGNIDDYQQAISIALKRPNLSLLALDGAVISGHKSKWPEREADAVMSEGNKWIKWIPVGPTKENGKKKKSIYAGGLYDIWAISRRINR